MKTKAGMAFAAFALAMTAVALYAADANPIAGSWATNAVGEVDIPQSAGFFGKMAASAINGGNTTSSIGNSSGTPTFTGPAATGRGGRPSMGVRGPDKAPDEPAIMMDLQVDSKGKLSGTVSEITVIPVYALKKLKAEGVGTVTEKKFEFTTNEKSEKVSNTTRWVGELTDERTISIKRMTKGGNEIDGGPIVFYRAKK